MDSRRLVARFQSGDRAAFDHLYNHWAPRVQRFFANALADKHAAEDATQRVFLDVLRALPRYRVRVASQFEAWLFTIARNRLSNELRDRDPAEPMEPETVNALHETVRASSGRSEWLSDEALAADFAELPRRQRQVLTLRYALGFNNREIACMLGITPGHVGVLQQRARAALASKRVDRDRATGNRSDPALSCRREAPTRVLTERRQILQLA